MSLNQCMHPRNIYKTNPPDFKELSELYPEFKTFVKLGRSGKAVVNFRNAEAIRVLSKCLLHKDFKLNVLLPTNRLAPTIPSRLNYVLWIQDLMNATTCESSRKRIIDIGTGSSCIYPLLGVKTDPKWKFTATEIDEINFKNAMENIETNSFQDRIQLVRVNPECKTLLKPLFEENADRYDCCMCNPPFFSDFDESCGKTDRPVANSSCHAAYTEAITEGGDLAFAMKLFKESLELKERLIWYTIMFGKKKSFTALKNIILKEDQGGLLWTSYEFCQGNTVRWGAAWTFCPHLVDESKIPESRLKLALKQNRSCKPILITITTSCSLASACESVMLALEELGVGVSEVSRNDTMLEFHASAKEANWIHVRQRNRKRKLNGIPNAAVVHTETLKIDPLLNFVIKLSFNPAGYVNVAFKPANPNQKELLNGLVVYLKRLIFKTSSVR